MCQNKYLVYFLNILEMVAIFVKNFLSQNWF